MIDIFIIKIGVLSKVYKKVLLAVYSHCLNRSNPVKRYSIYILSTNFLYLGSM